MKNSTYEIIWQVVSQIPKGAVASYGQIAKLTGLHLNPRVVGYALRATGDEISIPWHRVINSQGKISFPEDSHQFKIQKAILMEEGILFKNNKVDLKEFRWKAKL